MRLPSVDDLTVYRVLRKLVVFEGQRLSYATLDVEQIGSVYEALMGYHVVRVFSDAVCLRPSRAWVEARDVLEVPVARRAKWLQETTGLAKAQAKKLHEALKDAETEDDVAAGLEGFRVKGTVRAHAGRLVVQPGAERRRTSSHYTPRSLSAPIVERTLEPLLKTMGEAPAAERILRLKVCDPAMGSGAFLVEACRYLADQVVAAWTRDGELDEVVREHGDDVWNHARRLVAQRCLYGVDRNPFAVSLAKLSLWLVTMARDLPFTFLDHALRCGDSLVGLDFEQIRSFHWKPEAQSVLCSKALDDALDEAIVLRQKILELAESADPEDHREKEKLLDDAEDAVNNVRLIGDLIIGAFFAGKNDRERKQELGRRLALVNEWLESDRPATDVLKGLRNEIQERFPVFHWMLEFPEVFYAERRDPLDSDKVNRAAFIDGVIGNPPFMGVSRISGTLGNEYLGWINYTFKNSGGKSDLAAYFFRQSTSLLGMHGTMGLIATNTIAQGDTRTSGIQQILVEGGAIYNARRSERWPGEAAVEIAIIHIAKGYPSDLTAKHIRLDGSPAKAIDSYLQPRSERSDPGLLQLNSSLAFNGVKIYGQGFILTPDERCTMIEESRLNEDRIWPYAGGDEINSTPVEVFDRYVINFEDMSLEEAAGIRYTASDCFETFPFPHPDPRTEIPTLEDIGHRLYEARAAYMLETQQGLTKTYNHLKDPTCTDPPIVELRRLHEEMDRAVLEAYGWDVDVPPYVSPVTEGERRRLEAFEDEVIDQLFVLNAARAAEERALGLVKEKKKKPPKKPKKKRDVHAGQGSLFGLLALPEDVPSGLAGETPALPAGDEARTAVVEYLAAQASWCSRADVLASVELTAGEWNRAIGELVASGEVERKGEKRGTRYRWRGDDRSLVAWWFAEHPGWHSRQEVIEDLEIDAATWNRAIRELVESEEVVRTGEKRGTRYRWWEHG